MAKIYTPDSSPEDLAELTSHVKVLAEFLNTNPQAKRLLEQAKAGHISKEDCVNGLLELDRVPVDTVTGNNI